MFSNLKVLPTPETRLYKILNDTEFRRVFLTNLKTYNPLIVTLYRSGILPLFGFSRTILLLTTTGRKSGKPRVTPIGYFRIGGVIHLFSAWGKGAGWYKNMIANPGNVHIQIGLRRWSVQAQILTEPDEIQHTIGQLVAESPYQAQALFGWQPDRDHTDEIDFSVVLEKVIVVRFVNKPTSKPPSQPSNQEEKE
jgi:deazaflavin-dependent oxidoreductase (nitroreductase family)